MFFLIISPGQRLNSRPWFIHVYPISIYQFQGAGNTYKLNCYNKWRLLLRNFGHTQEICGFLPVLHAIPRTFIQELQGLQLLSSGQEHVIHRCQVREGHGHHILKGDPDLRGSGGCWGETISSAGEVDPEDWGRANFEIFKVLEHVV